MMTLKEKNGESNNHVNWDSSEALWQAADPTKDNTCNTFNLLVMV